MTLNRLIFEAAGAHLGTEEWPGARHNPKVVSFFAAAGHPQIRDDETPWCAAFVGAVLGEVGVQGSGSLAARSYLQWGLPVARADARPGDVVVFWRGSPDSWQGHVGFLVRIEGDRVIVRGGNQGNKVSDAPYALTRLLAIRRAPGAEQPRSGSSSSPLLARPVLRLGVSGTFVQVLQARLVGLGFLSGPVDGVFGPQTLAAVRQAQTDLGLAIDGIVGPATWAALDRAASGVEPVAVTRDRNLLAMVRAGLQTLLRRIAK